MTACILGSAPSPTFGNEYGMPLPFYRVDIVLVAQEQRANEVFIDVIERLMVSVAADVSCLVAAEHLSLSSDGSVY